MFTGIVEEVGTVRRVLPSARAGKIVVAAKKVLSDVHFGDSIAVNGVCLTVTSFSADEFTADVMPETIYHMNGTITDNQNAEGDYDVVIAPYTNDIEEVRQFTKGKNELLPVPQTVIDVNPNITQNPNY